jgi:hypothetical protein
MIDEGHIDEAQMIDLVSEVLPRADRTDALDHLASCAGCEERFRKLVADRETIRSAGIPASASAAAQEPGENQRRGSRAILWGAVAAAAIVAALMLAPVWLGRDAGEFRVWIPTDRARALPRVPVSSELDGALDDALAAYESRDAARALRLLRLAEVSDDLELMRQIYLASALVLNGRGAEAVDVLDRLEVDTIPQPDRRWTQLTLYAAFRQVGRDDEADRLIGKLATEPGKVGELARDEIARFESLE